MDLKSLKIFVEIVRCQSFSLAAEQLCLTQPTVSKAIRQLEEALGTALFNKGQAGRKREVSLTYSGQQIYQHALAMLENEKKIYSTLDEIRQVQKGKLALGLPPLGSVLLSALIALFHRQYPEIELSFLEVGANGIEEALLNRQIDVGILLGQLDSKFSGIQILDSPLCVLSHQQSYLQYRKAVGLRELEHESFLLYADTFTLNQMILQAAQQVGFEPKVLCKSSQWDFIAKMVEAGMGIALLPEVYCKRLDAKSFNMTRLIEPNLNWTLNMAWYNQSPMSPATRAWLKIIEQHQQLIHF